MPAIPLDYSLNLPPGFTVFTDPTDSFNEPFHGFGFGFNPGNPPITNHGATLGRVLFYDPLLSLNNSTSCASCHHQELAFSDGRASSKGFAGATTPRNSMAIINAGFNNNLFWDARESNVKGLVTRPIQNHIEIGVEEMRRLECKLAKVDYYRPCSRPLLAIPRLRKTVLPAPWRSLSVLLPLQIPGSTRQCLPI